MKIAPNGHEKDRDRRYADLLEKDTCVIVFSYVNHLRYLEACLRSLRRLDLFVILCYDKPYWDRVADVPLERRLPPPNVWNLFDALVMKHNTHHGGVTWPWIWQMKYTIPVVEELGFEYVLNITGDTIVERPEGLSQVREALDGHDLASYWYNDAKVGTLCWFSTTEVQRRITNYCSGTFFDEFEPGTAEDRVSRAVKALGLSVAPTKKEEFNFLLLPDGCELAGGKVPADRGFFGEVLGLRHLHAEFKIRMNEGLPALGDDLVDRRFLKKRELKEYEIKI